MNGLIACRGRELLVEEYVMTGWAFDGHEIGSRVGFPAEDRAQVAYPRDSQKMILFRKQEGAS
jgi:hypothetical protein